MRCQCHGSAPRLQHRQSGYMRLALAMSGYPETELAHRPHVFDNARIPYW